MPTYGPLQSQVYVNPLLSNLSIAYQNDTYVADILFPEIQVKQRTGIYFTYDKSKFRLVNTLRSPGTRAQRVEYGLSQSTYGPLLDHALEQIIEDEVREESMAPLDPDIDAVDNLTERIMLDKENDAFTQSSNTGTITQNVTLSGTSQWSDYANSDPIGDVRTAIDTVKAAVLKRPNTLVLGYQVYSVLRNHPQIIERIKYSQLGVVTADLLAAVFDIAKVIIADAEYNTSTEGQTDALSYIWGKNAWVLYINPAPAIRRVSYGYTFRRGARQVRTWRQEAEEADFVEVKDYYQQLIIAAPAAYYIHNAVA